MTQPGRDFSNEKYRFGFDGKENDNEVKGEGNSIDFGARIYDARLGRLLSLDPLSQKFPSESNYSFAGNSPLLFIDEEGEKKTVYLTIIGKNGEKTTFKRIDNRDVRIALAATASETWSHVQVKDIEQSVVIDLSKGTYSVSAEKVTGTYAMGLGEYIEKGLVGLGDVQEGGWNVTSKNGGVDPTRNTSNSFAEEENNVLENLVLPGIEDRGMTESVKKLGVGKQREEKLGELNEDLKAVADIFVKSVEAAVGAANVVQKAVSNTSAKGGETGTDPGFSGKYATCQNGSCKGDTMPLEKAVSGGHTPKDILVKDKSGNYSKANAKNEPY